MADQARSRPGVTVRSLLADKQLGITVYLAAGSSGLDRHIAHPRIQKSGLVLVGHAHGLVPERVQVLGETELSYIEALSDEQQSEAASHLFSLKPGLVLITRGVTVPRAFLEAAEESGTPLAVCAEETSFAITELHTLLDERLAPRSRIHGVLVDVFEVGVLLLGKSGIGKSECALDLVQRGHRLVADDVIECDYRPPGMVFGEAAPLLRNHIEVRGLGILDIKELFGVTAIRDRKRIDLIVQFEEGNVEQKLDRLGVDGRTKEILGVPIREVMLVLRPGRSASSLIEMAARNELLRTAGIDTSLDFVDRIDQSLVRRPNESGAMHAVVAPRPFTPRPHAPPSEFESQKPPPPPSTPRKVVP
jgi:HPr kinase/phosphorylase